MVDTIYHDRVELIDRHPIHFKEFANQGSRKFAPGILPLDVNKIVIQADDKSFWRVDSVGPLTYTPFTPPAPSLVDVGKILAVISDGDGYLKYGWITSSAAPTFDDVYGNESGTHSINVSDGSILWNLYDGYDNTVDLSNLTSTSSGNKTINGTDYFNLIRKGTNLIDLETELQNISLKSSLNLSLKDQYLTSSVNLSQSGQAALATTSQSIIGAINEINGISSSLTFDDIYGNESGTHTINVDDGDVSWGLNGAYSFAISLSTAADNESFYVGNGTDYFSVKRIGSNAIDILSEVSTFDINSGIFDTLTTSHFSIVSTGISNNCTVVTQGASADLVLGSRGQTITLNQLGETTYDGTATSIIGALNENKGLADAAQADIDAHNLNAAYNVDPGAANVTLNKGDISINGSGAYSFAVNMAATAGTADGVQFVNGTDQFNLIKKGTDLLDLDADLQAANIAASTTLSLSAAGNFNLSGQTIISLATTGGGISLNPSTTAYFINNTAYSSAPVTAFSMSRNSTSGHAWMQMKGSSGGQPLLFNPVGGNVTCFEGIAEGTTPEFKVGGFRTGDILRFFEVAVGIDAPDTASLNGVSHFRFDGVLQPAKGRNMLSANDMVAPDGNYNDVTGSTQINTMSATNIQAGTFIALQFDSNPVVKHATSGTGAQFQLAGSADFSTTAGDTLLVVYDGTYWREIARTAI